MKEGSVLHGFLVRRVRPLPELNGSLWEMEHEKTGAQLCWVDRKDENKAFSIAFKTLPEDSTGVFHILEHSVLCGSDRYPVKEPFVQLQKSSLQTFLNAMTFPDKTVYPVSSRNDRDLLNLMDVYLDAVFHPAICHRPEIFMQEGWHYECCDTPVYQGVVLNEMKGAFGSCEMVLESEMNRLLFPDNCYSHVSGGDPEHITDLRYERFLEMYHRYYHPSNARISLAGSVDIDSVLEKIDGYLKEYDRQNLCFDIPMQACVDAVTEEIPYEIGSDESCEGRTVISFGKIFASYDEQARIYAAFILADYLCGDNDAPLKKALLEAGLCQDVNISVHNGLQQTWISVDVWNTDRSKLDIIRKTVRETIEITVRSGPDSQRLSSCYSHYAFRLRDYDNTGYPRSLLEALNVLDTWLYGGDPAMGLLVDEPLSCLKENLNSTYFSDLLKDLFLDEAHTVTAVLVPSQTLGAEKVQAEAERISAAFASMTEEEKAETEKQNEQLVLWQETPDSPEALASVPMLCLEDLQNKPAPLPVEVKERNGMTVLTHTTGSSLAYLHAHFNAADLEKEELPVLVLLCMMLGNLPTFRHSGEQLQMLIREKIGRLSFRPVILGGSDEKHCIIHLNASVSSLKSQMEEAVELFCEILRETVYTDRKLLKDMISQLIMNAQMSLPGGGHMYGLTRVDARTSASGIAKEYTGGIELISFLKKLNTADDEVLDKLLLQMETIAHRLLVRKRLTISCSEYVSGSVLDRISLPDGEQTVDEACYEPMGSSQEGIMIPASVGYAVTGTNLKLHDWSFTGHLPVLANVLNFDYLWNRIRVQGGAYGCGFVARGDGSVGFYTYRDPQPGRSLGIMKEASSFLRSFCQENPDLTGYILSSVSSLDPLMGTEEKITEAENRYFRHLSYEDICERYTELISTVPQDLLSMTDILDAIAEDQNICVVAGRNQMEECSELLNEIKTV